MRRLAAGLLLTVALTLAGAAGAAALSVPAVRLDPATTAAGTSLLVSLDGRGLVSGGAAATSLEIALPRGTRLDARATAQHCTAAQARAARCPKASRIGFGRAITAVTGFLAPGGDSAASWTIDAYLAGPTRSGDLAAVVLRAELLGPDRVQQLLQPLLAAPLAGVTVITGRVLPPAGEFGPRLRFPALPGAISARAPGTAAPTVFELALSAVRRVRRDVVRHVVVPTRTGHRVQAIPDHHLVGHDLLTAPPRCAGPWAYEVRTGFPGRLVTSAGTVLCTAP